MKVSNASKIYKSVGAEAVLTEAEDLRKYLTGISTSFGYVLSDKDGNTFYTDLRYFEAATNSLKGTDIAVNEFVPPFENLLNGYKEVAIPLGRTLYNDYNKLKACGLEVKDSLPYFTSAMSVKDELEIENIEICKDREEGNSFPPPNGYVLLSMRYRDKSFTVQINGENETLEGIDDFQYELITADAKKYFESLLTYEIHDIYLEYKENMISGDPYQDRQNVNLISEYYESGDLENFLQQHPVNIRIDDCSNQDLTKLAEINTNAASFFEKYAASYQTNTILISYRSKEDYQKGYSHTYGRYGLLTYEIYDDGLYIRSYAAFDKDETETACFALQEYDNIMFSYLDHGSDNAPVISDHQAQWRETGDTKGNPLSKIYSVITEQSGEITVYIPADQFEQYGKKPSLFIQHYYENKWWQYDPNLLSTTDKNYIFFVFHGVHGSSFDFAVFS